VPMRHDIARGMVNNAGVRQEDGLYPRVGHARWWCDIKGYPAHRTRRGLPVRRGSAGLTTTTRGSRELPPLATAGLSATAVAAATATAAAAAAAAAAATAATATARWLATRRLGGTSAWGGQLRSGRWRHRRLGPLRRCCRRAGRRLGH